MTKKTIKSMLLAVMSVCSLNIFAQATLIEKKEVVPGTLMIPYEKWKLPNGLTILIHEDHSDPIVHVEVLYKVGSSRESLGKSGFAHFFEHMMFQGSKNVGDEQHFKIVSEVGGDMNGNTTNDRTVYFETVPSNQLETALWLESDRMGFLLDSLTSKKFENQRDAVKNEKSQNVENQPYAMGFVEYLPQILYPSKHPYSWSTIGYVDDLNRASLQDVKNFFMRWYGPNNAILTVAGDVDPKEVIKHAEKYFGSIKTGPEVKKMKAPPVLLPTDKYYSYKDNVYLPMMIRATPTVPNYHRDEAALDIMALMLGDGNNSLMYKNFIKSKIALDASVSHGCEELSGSLEMVLLAYPPDDLNIEKLFNELNEKVKQTLDQFEKEGITDEALARSKAKIESQNISSVSSVAGKASILEAWEFLVGKPWNLNDEIDRYARVTKEDVARVFNKYIKGAGSAIVTVYPNFGKRDSLKSVNPYAGLAGTDEAEYAGLKYEAATENFDRSKRPTPTTAKPAIIPDYYTTNLSNGLKIIGTKTSETPMVTLLMTIDGGDLTLSADDLKKVGLANLTAGVMNEGTQNYTTEQVSAELEKLGASISFNAGKTSSNVYVSTPKKNIDATLKLLEEKLYRPRFDAEDFKRVKKQIKESLKYEKAQAGALASKAYMNALYGNNSIYGVYATASKVDKLELEDVKGFYEKNYSPSVASLVVVGDIDEKEILPKLQFLNNWKAKDVKINKPVVTAAEPMVYLIDKPFAASSTIYAGQHAIPYDATGEYFKNTIMNYVLGGAFNSRLNLNLREDKGYTYGIRSYFSGDKQLGRYTVSTDVKRMSTANSLTEIFKELNGYVDKGITDAELSFTKNSLLNSDALNYETPFQKAGFLSEIIQYNLPTDFTAQQAQIVKTISKEDLLAQARKNLTPNKMVIVVVGHLDAIKKPIEKLGLGKVKEITLD